MLPTAPTAVRLISPEAVTVPDRVGADRVSPEIVVTVAPELMVVEPRVGAVYPGAGVAHLTPSVSAESAVRT